MQKKLSIIIPTLNEEKYLPLLLKDLKSQTIKDFEVLVVDAYSDDKTCEKALEFNSGLDIRVVESDKRHLAYQRNLAARNAKGEYLLFIDADVHVKSIFIEKLFDYIERYNFILYLPIHLPHDAEYVDELLYKIMAVFTDASHMTNKPFAYGSSVVFERHFFEHLKGYDADVFVYEDHEIIQRARKQGVKAKLMTDNPVFFSFRRYRSEGRISLLSKYTLATLHLLAYGKVDKKIFSYEMGGSAKYLLKQRKYFDIQKNAIKYFDKLRKLLEE